MNYKIINRDLLKRYKKHLIAKRTDLHVKAIGSYWTKYKWTTNDQNTWQILENKIRNLNTIIC